jgi:S-adenosylmethionine:tRNA ribosyltransferase-isomerase
MEASMIPAVLEPARAPPHRRDDGRLLVVDPSGGALRDASFVELPALLAPTDLLVVNDAATMPASIAGRVRDLDVEVRLVGAVADKRWRVVLFGTGDWRTPTEERPSPPRVALGDAFVFGGLPARVVEVSPLSPRLVVLEVDVDSPQFWSTLYARGVPIQYSHMRAPLDLWSVQTSYAARPWAVEMPSAGRPLSFRVLAGLRARGVQLATLTHAAGLSATGDAALDRALPLEERYEIPQATVDVIAATRARGGRVIAVGTSVVRALEGAAQGHGLVAGAGSTTLRISEDTRRAVVDGMLSGMHVPGESHFELLLAFAPRAVWERALLHAARAGYRAHELGDSALVLPPLGAPLTRVRG